MNHTLPCAETKLFQPISADNRYMHGSQHMHPKYLLHSTCAPQCPSSHLENVRSLLNDSPLKLQAVGVHRKYKSSPRLLAFQPCSDASNSPLFSEVKGKCGQLWRITTACCAERCVKSKTFARRKEEIDCPGQSLLGKAVWVNDSCLLLNEDTVLKKGCFTLRFIWQRDTWCLHGLQPLTMCKRDWDLASVIPKCSWALTPLQAQG